ncbi:anti-sigma factor domain-containing protein [Tumebacillus flagellatus]|uniref:RsgI N-terminal anti-sigma domain-containing protein n=1 Tax=Tumebacillus flagellatus TaxID=1157490 RepID=A0A074M8E1_9BACL|nr:anti-sigma factor domain-containing protein [Tumebacillus flagellatus]KEO82252.1 hypothetical protein EL26_16510 [Tumebacillus flagellatus]
MQSKGIVMQIAGEQAIVMTKDCQFRKIPFLDGMAIGAEVELPADVTVVPSVKKSKRSWYSKPWRKTGLAAASVLLAIGLWGSQSFLGEKPAYAYVTVDINPSVELSIDKDSHVLQAVALNDEANSVLNSVKLKGLTVDQAVEQLAQTAGQQGYFQNQTEVIITASAAVDEAKLKQGNIDLIQLEDNLVSKVKTVAATQSPGVEVEGLLVSKDVREAAKQEGVSPGKYALYLNATSNGIDVDLEDLKKQPIHKVVDQQPQIAEVVHQMQGGQELDTLLKTLKEQGKPQLLNQGKNRGILPSGQSNETGKKPDEGQQIPPGQAKKEDAEQKDDKQKVQPQSTTKPSDRESGSKPGNGNGNNGKSSKKDDDSHSNGKDNGNGKNKDNNKNNNEDGKNNKNGKDNEPKVKPQSNPSNNGKSQSSKKKDDNWDDQSQSRGQYDLHIRFANWH